MDTEKNIKVQTVVLKLFNGEDVVCHLRRIDDVHIQINFPLTIEVDNNGRGHFSRWTMSKEALVEDGWIDINPMAVISIGTPPNDIEDSYKDIFAKTFSKIVQPTPEETKLIKQ